MPNRIRRIRTFDLEHWRESARAFFDITPLTDAKTFVGQVSFDQLGRLILTKVSFSSQKMDHQPVRLRGFDHGYLLFERYSAGCGRGVVDEEPTRIDATCMHLVDMSRPYLTMTTHVRAEGVIIPHDLVGYDPSRHQAYASVPAASPPGQILAAALHSLRDAVDGLSCDDACALTAAFCGLVRTHLLGERDPGEACGERSRALLLRSYILRHLDDPELTVERLCRDLGMSRATLYRLLEEAGGAVHYIAGLRLDRCLAQLLQMKAERGCVRRVAEQWGFHDPASFNHRFRERFGFAPSDCLGSGSGEPDGAEALTASGVASEAVQQWMRKL